MINEKVSIIIPVFNCPNYINTCTNAILNNSYSELEVLLIDDGSTDGTAAVCDDIAREDERVTVVHKKNSGPSGARNTGLDIATGKYVVFVDADDLISQYFVEHLVQLIESDNAVLGQVCYKTFSGDVIINAEEKNLQNVEKIAAEEAFDKLWSGGKVDSYLWNKIFKMEIIKKNNVRFYEDTAIWEDSLFIFEYLMIATGVCTSANSPDYYYRINPESITHKRIDAHKNDGKFLTLLRLRDLAKKKHSEDLGRAVDMAIFPVAKSRFMNIEAISDEMRTAYIQGIRQTQSISLGRKATLYLLYYVGKAWRKNDQNKK